MTTEDLLRGLLRFKKEYFANYEEHFRRLVAEGQSPKTLFIGCSDSRVLPDRLTGTQPGELFVVRNVGNIVPPYEADAGYHGVSAAIEYAVEVLNVQNIILCGHSHCGAIRALYLPPSEGTPHVSRWLGLATEAKMPGELSEPLLRWTERRSIAVQLERITHFPPVRDRLEAGKITLHGWYYVIEEGVVEILDMASQRFVRYSEVDAETEA